MVKSLCYINMGIVEINFHVDGLDKLGGIIGQIFGKNPQKIKKLADAEQYAVLKGVETETKAELLRIKGQYEIAQYLAFRETRKFNNASAVVKAAESNFTKGEKVSSDPVSQSWVNRFFDIAENISEQDIQEIWGKILAGEVKQPGSYSLRTLDTLQYLTHEDAELFARVVKYYLASGFIVNEDFSMTLVERMRLVDSGLLLSEDLVKKWQIEPHKEELVKIDNNYFFRLINETDKIVRCSCGVEKMTTAGIELMRLLPQEDRSDFYSLFAGFLKSRGVSRVFKHKSIDNGKDFSIIGDEL